MIEDISVRPIWVADPDTPAWHEARKTGFGASEAAAALNVSPYESAAELYARKRGEIPEPEENMAMIDGRFSEPAILAMWQYVNQRELQAYPMALYRHPEHPYVLATPDAEIEDGHGVEVKTINDRVLRMIDDAGVYAALPHYFLQAQQQMAVMGWNHVTLLAKCGHDLHEYPIERNEKTIRLIIEIEGVLWDRIQRGDPPPVHESARFADAVKSLYRSVDPGKVILLSDAAVEALDRCEERRAEINRLEAANKVDRALALAEIGNLEAGVIRGRGKMLKRTVMPARSKLVEYKESITSRIVNCDVETEQAAIDAACESLGIGVEQNLIESGSTT